IPYVVIVQVFGFKGEFAGNLEDKAMFPIQEAERALGVSFRDSKLLVRAFTHRSMLANRAHDRLMTYERLEFLGDAALELIVSDFLYKTAPNADEGQLTTLRSRIVNRVTLTHCAKRFDIGRFIVMSNGQHYENERNSQAFDIILSCVIEAVIGALYVDQGLVAARTFVVRSIFPYLDESVTDARTCNPKGIVQEKAQAILRVTPNYMLVKQVGPTHNSSFTMACYFGDQLVGTGTGRSKKEAEQKAAAAVLETQGW
ncbi:MAG: ribonuclease III, partial [Patescibacteria group bacterium]